MGAWRGEEIGAMGQGHGVSYLNSESLMRSELPISR